MFCYAASAKDISTNKVSHIAAEVFDEVSHAFETRNVVVVDFDHLEIKKQILLF